MITAFWNNRKRSSFGRVFCLLVGIVAVHTGYTQDRIFLVNDSICFGKIISKLDKRISFETVTYPIDTLHVRKKDVALIIYQNGKYKVYHSNYRSVIGEAAMQRDKEIWNSVPKNQIKLNAFVLKYAQTAEIIYQRRLSNFLALETPVSFRLEWFDSEYLIYDLRKNFAIGLSTLIFPVAKPKAPVEFYLGPSIEFGNSPIEKKSERNLNYQSLALRLGVFVKLSNWFGLGTELTPGYRYYYGIPGKETTLSLNFNLISKF